MRIAKKHGSTVFLLVADGFWEAWPRQFLVAFVVALPAAFVARRVATAVVARLTA